MKSLQILAGVFISLVIFQRASTAPDKVYEPDIAMTITDWYRQSDAHYTTLEKGLQYTHIPCRRETSIIYSSRVAGSDRFTLLSGGENSSPGKMPQSFPAELVRRDTSHFVIIKKLTDGSVAVGLFNRAETPGQVSVDFVEAGLKGKKPVRDLWRKKNIGRYKDKFTAIVPGQGVIMVRIGK